MPIEEVGRAGLSAYNPNEDGAQNPDNIKRSEAQNQQQSALLDERFGLPSRAINSGNGVNSAAFSSSAAASSADHVVLKMSESSSGQGVDSTNHAREALLTFAQVAQLSGKICDEISRLEASVLEQGAQGLDADESARHQQTVIEVQEVVSHVLSDEPIETLGVSDPAALHVNSVIRDAVEDARLSAGGTLTPEQKRLVVLGALGHVTEESFTDTARRWGKNIGIVALRTGLIVATLTTLRQSIGFSTERMMQTGEMTLGGRCAFGVGLSLLGPAINIAGAIRDEVRGTASIDSRAARAKMLAVSAAAMAVTYASGTQGVVPGFLAQAAFYTLARDAKQAGLPLKSNADGLSPAAVSVGQTAYGLGQLLVGEAMDRAAPVSGAGAAMNRSNISTDWGQNLTRGAINFGPEVFDDLLFNGVNRMIEVNNNKELIRVQAPLLLNKLNDIVKNAEEEGAANGLTGSSLESHVRQAASAEVHRMTEGLRLWVEPRIPTIQQFGDQILTTSAMRTSAFQAVYGLAIAADALIGTNVPAATKQALVNMLTAGMLAFIYEPFVNVHRQSSATPPLRHASTAEIEMQDLPQSNTLRRRNIRQAGEEAIPLNYAGNSGE
ncbi:hypothetical protein [Burkholderia territorii]|uniref:hypothetical protein n=1 Tax=Burkholderia territorii TaxID=1503055 RepID=UPI000B307BB4|nr:hypothetical protein [Burkholderia territorii]